MSFVIRVELPTYSHSFQVSVPPTGTVSDVKQEIERVCPGKPSVHGQRLIWRGRFLGDDEKMLNIWKSPNDVPVVHLAVHPSAWAGSPPTVATISTPVPTAASSAAPPPAQANNSTDGYFPASQPVPNQHPAPPPRQQAQPAANSPPAAALPAPTSVPGLAPISVGYLNFVAYQHMCAATVLRFGHTVEDPPPTGLAGSRNLAMQLMTQWGYAWPTVFDEEYPPPQDESAGIKYEPVTLDGQDYLKLVDPSRTPTPLQAHALRVMGHTFALLAMPLPSASAYPMMPLPPPRGHTHLPVHINAHLQQIGLAPLRVRQENAMIAELRAVPMRALAAPLLMLILRTLFLLYFFSPFQKPVLGIVVAAWLLYETWNTIRNAIPRLNMRGIHGGEDARIIGNAHARAAEVAHPLAPNVALRAPAPPPHRTPVQPQRPPSVTMMDTLASVNLREESSALDARPEAVAAPTLGHRVKTFIELLLITAHPALWDRRRAALRQREGRVRTEINAREAPAPTPEGESEAWAGARAELNAVHLRRPGWIREYVERVGRGGDWVDDQ